MTKALRRAHREASSTFAWAHGVSTHCAQRAVLGGQPEERAWTSERRTAAGLASDPPSLLCCPRISMPLVYLTVVPRASALSRGHFRARAGMQLTDKRCNEG